jgi:hypothetical protein
MYNGGQDHGVNQLGNINREDLVIIFFIIGNELQHWRKFKRTWNSNYDEHHDQKQLGDSNGECPQKKSVDIILKANQSNIKFICTMVNIIKNNWETP